MPHFHFFIIGGGAAGMCAALGARSLLRQKGIPDNACRIGIAERNNRLGIKIRISGGGKCNITHAGSMMSVLAEGFFRQSEQRFLKPSFFELSNDVVLSWLHDKGVQTLTRENGRIFPKSGKADDVLCVFEELLSEHCIEVLLNAHVRHIRKENGVFIAEVGETHIESQYLLIATGGISYSKTGTTGDGLRFAKQFGHTVINPISALAPIYFTQKPQSDLIGISLRNTLLIAETPTRIFTRRGDVLITHLGISGPACLSISREVAEALATERISLFVDFFPDESAEVLERQFILFQTARAGQFVRTFFEERLPNAVVAPLLTQAEVPLEQKWNSLSKQMRRKLTAVSKKYFLSVVKEVPLERGEVSAGGVALFEVSPKTMRSRLVPNLYFAGEVLDVAGEVGGFNLQAAYSTGWVAGKSVAKSLLAERNLLRDGD
ncbi:MAG: NAD(P)/FAD-dependent oxidoreductase [Chlorobiales bacterium]